MVQRKLLTIHPRASMVERRLPEVGPPSARVPERGLLVLPISEARRRRNRDEITKKGFVFEGFTSRGIYRRRGQPEVDQGPQAPPWRGPGGGRAGWPPGPPLAPLWPHSGSSRSFLYADFSYIFPRIFLALFYEGKLKYKNSRKQELALRCTELIG